MAKQVLSIKCVLLALLFVSFVQDATAYKAANSATQSKKNTTRAHNSVSPSGARSVPVLRDFDKLRGFKSYDPATDKWSTIEDFETVDILEDTTEQREENYIYHSFWAYDVVTNCWHKVDIRDYGYKLSKLATTEKPEISESASPKSSGFWKNWALGLRVGAGPTFYENKIAHCSITEREGEDFFLQTAKGEKNKKSYKIHWLGAGYTKCGDPWVGSKGVLDTRKVEVGKKILFEGRGWNVPITLFTHYTFFRRLRVGAGCELEVNYLKELIPKGDASHLKPFKIPLAHQWFYNIAWFGLLGFKVIHTPHHDVVVDFQLGRNYNAGATPKDLLIGKGHLYDGWLLGAGIAYERKLSSYFRLLTRLSGDWKMHNDTPLSINDPLASVKLNQVALHLDLGIQVSFGKDTEEAENAEKLDADHEFDAAPVKDSSEDTKKPT